MSRIRYECHMSVPEVVAACANCTRADCDGICNDYRNAVRRHLGLKPLPNHEKRGERIGISGRKKAPREPRHYNTRRIECNGESHTLGEWAEIGGMDYNTLYMRLYRGMSIEEAMGLPVCKAEGRSITVDGVTLTVRQWAERLGLKRGTIYERIRRGYTPGQAVTMERMT